MENTDEIKSLRTYKAFKEEHYKYRVDEILGHIEYNNNEYLNFNKQSDKVYNELKEMLNDNGKKLLLNYADFEISKKDCELYALAEQVYKDLKEER